MSRQINLRVILTKRWQQQRQVKYQRLISNTEHNGKKNTLNEINHSFAFGVMLILWTFCSN